MQDMVTVPGGGLVGTCPFDLSDKVVGCDQDGTLSDFDYAPEHHGWINHALVAHLRDHNARKVVVVTNQGGLVWGEVGQVRKDGRRYPRIQDFLLRTRHVIGELRKVGITVQEIHVSLFHPAATAYEIFHTSDRLSSAWDEGTGLRTQTNLFLHTSEHSRKPSAFMLHMANVDIFYGDSGIDCAAANNAGVPFVPVDRHLPPKFAIDNS